MDLTEGNQSPSKYKKIDEEAHGKWRSSSSYFRKKERKSSSGDRKKGMKIEVISGDLTKMRVDVIVNSVDKSLDLSMGNISKSLSRAAGESLQDECNAKYKEGIEPGNVAITKGGNLSCKQVYHGAIQIWNNLKGDALGKLTDSVKECLRIADINQMSSIAFPALGTGILGYPPEQAAKTMFRCCREFHSKYRDTSLREIFFVIYYKDTEILKAFKTQESELESEKPEVPSQGIKYRGWRNPSTDLDGGDRCWKLHKMNVEVRLGDITQQNTDAIVNSITEKMDLTEGAVSKAVLRAGGDEIEAECRREGQSFSSEDYVVTSGGNMDCKYIIHVKGQIVAEGWERMVTKALAHADKTGCRSISFPALGTGVMHIDPAKIAKCMHRAFSKFLPVNLQTVRVIVFQSKMLTVFKSTLQTLSQMPLPQTKDDFTVKTRDMPWGFDDKVETSISSLWYYDKSFIHGKRINRRQGYGQKEMDGKLIVPSHSNSEESISDLKWPHNKYIWRDVDVSNYILRDNQIDQIKRVAKDTNIIVKDEVIKLYGLESSVNEAYIAIYKYLHEVKDKEIAKTVQKYVNWQYEASPETWTRFRDDVNLQIENTYQAKKDLCTVKDNVRNVYVIDFARMEKYEKYNYRKKYKIKRTEIGFPFGLPTTWTSMTNNQTVVEITLNRLDDEYKEVMSKFKVSINRTVSVSEIRRVQNLFLYHQYAAKRKEIEIKNGKDPQKWLWHGTYPETVDKVINNGFNRGYSGRNATLYGAGVYFAVNSSYSVGYCNPDSNGLKHMFSVQVATGDNCIGKRRMNVLPQKPGAGSHVTYDSACDNLSNPEMYVIFHDSQAYPAYHIIFK